MTFLKFETIIEVGGATGNLLLPSSADTADHVASFSTNRVPALIDARGPMAPINAEAANLFENVPAAGEAYVLSYIIRDWGEARCLTILFAQKRPT